MSARFPRPAGRYGSCYLRSIGLVDSVGGFDDTRERAMGDGLAVVGLLVTLLGLLVAVAVGVWKARGSIETSIADSARSMRETHERMEARMGARMDALRDELRADMRADRTLFAEQVNRLVAAVLKRPAD